MMKKARVLWQLLRYFGLGWLLFRIYYSLMLRSGYFRRVLPPYQWSDRPLSYWLRTDVPSTPEAYVEWRKANSTQFFFDRVPANEAFVDSSVLLAKADAILEGCWPYFTSKSFDIGIPPNWHLNPSTGQTVPANRHWSEISDFDSGDIKYIWEANRLSIVFTLGRAYALTGDARYPTMFWDLVNDWAKQNPPQLGPNWKCGQEATFRVMAWCFGLYSFGHHAQPDQITQLVAMIAAHGERIEKNIDYARSQNNNHGISEAVGLWTIGVLFPELKLAARWAKKGKQVFIAEMQKQVYADGTYAQYSANYQRVMLHDAIWALRLGELNNNRFPAEMYEKVSLSTRFLLQILDNPSGQIPNYGANDSALILPLNDADPNDFRPAIQAAYYLNHHERLFPGFDEDLLWLFGPGALDRPVLDAVPEQRNLAAAIGGFHTLRGEDSWLMVRCGRYKARPHHADQLHVDFWWRGMNICCDAGTYLYNGDGLWGNGLAATAAHNTVTVDQEDQMTRYSRFLWLDWSRGRVHHHDNTYWEGSHDGYAPVTHRRGIQRLNDVWVIVDTLTGDAPHDYCLHWLIPNFHYDLLDQEIRLETDQGPFFMQFSTCDVSFKKADDQSVLGWRSSRYGQKEPALSVSVNSNGQKQALFWTILSPRTVTVVKHSDRDLLVEGVPLTLGHDRLIETGAT